MKQDISKLTIAEQLCLTLDLLHRRYRSGQKATHACDLLEHFKLPHLHTRKQRVEHCDRLLRIAGEALAGRNIEKLVRQAAAAAIDYKVGDLVLYQGDRARVLELLPDGLVMLGTLDGDRVARRTDLERVEHALNSQPSTLNAR